MEQYNDNIKILVADKEHYTYVDEILATIAAAAKVRGTGIAKRNPGYVKQKMSEGKAVIALDGDKFAGFSYIETWGGKHYVTTSGLIVPEAYRGHGLAKKPANRESSEIVVMPSLSISRYSWNSGV